MPTSEKQKQYNQRYRDKQAKIKRLCKELDEAVLKMQQCPKCKACETAPVDCVHTPDRKRLNQEAELVRNQLQQLDH